MYIYICTHIYTYRVQGQLGGGLEKQRKNSKSKKETQSRGSKECVGLQANFCLVSL